MLPSSCDRRAVEQEKKAAWLHQEGGMPNQGERCSSDARSCWVSVTGTWCQLHVFWKCLVSARPALPREWEVNGIEEGDHRLRGFLGGGRTGGRGGVLHAEHPGPNQGSSHIRETTEQPGNPPSPKNASNFRKIIQSIILWKQKMWSPSKHSRYTFPSKV